MRKTFGLLLSAVVLVALLAGMQITAFAALASDETSIRADEASVAPGVTNAAASVPETSVPDEVSRLNDINPISANPETGSENLAIPAAIALLAASTAAIALSAKNKEEK